MYLNDVFTVPASLAGLPGVSVPAALSSGWLAARPPAPGAGPSTRRPCCAPPTCWSARRAFEATSRSPGGGRRHEQRKEKPGGQGATGAWEDGHRPRGPCPGGVGGQALLGRRCREFGAASPTAQVSLVDAGHAGHAAGDQPILRRAGGAHGPRAQRREINNRLRVRPQELLLPRPAGKAIRFPSFKRPDRRQGYVVHAGSSPDGSMPPRSASTRLHLEQDAGKSHARPPLPSRSVCGPQPLRAWR